MNRQLKRDFGRSVPMNFTLNNRVKEMLRAISKKEGITMSHIIRQLIESQYQEGDYGEKEKNE